MGLRGLQILVIEDAPDLLGVLTMLLRIEGADVAAAGSGQEALRVFRSRYFDVVVSDLGLPDISGDVLIRAIIEAARRLINIVVITGESQPPVTRALEAGAGIIFAKPCQWTSVVTYLDGTPPGTRCLTLASAPSPRCTTLRRSSPIGYWTKVPTRF